MLTLKSVEKRTSVKIKNFPQALILRHSENLSRIRIRMYSAPEPNPDPDQNEHEKQGPDPNKVGWVHNTGYATLEDSWAVTDCHDYYTCCVSGTILIESGSDSPSPYVSRSRYQSWSNFFMAFHIKIWTRKMTRSRILSDPAISEILFGNSVH